MVVPTGRTGQRYVDEGENIVRDGLVLYLDAKHSYPSKTGIGTTTSGAAAPAGSSTDPDVYNWYDMSGYENNGTLINNVGYNAANGGSLVFDGLNDYVSISNSPTVNPNSSSFSIIVWINSDPSNGGDNWDLWVAKRVSGSNGYYLGVNYPDGAKFILGNDASQRTDTGYVSYTYNTWAMFTAILNRETNTQTIIKNNYQETATVTPAGGNYFNTGVLSIGGDIGNGSQFYVNGKISVVQIYNKALTQEEVLQNYNAYKSRFGL